MCFMEVHNFGKFFSYPVAAYSDALSHLVTASIVDETAINL